MKNKRFKRGLLYIAFAALMLFFVQNFNAGWSILLEVLSVFTPFIYGFIIAYILKFPCNFFEKKAFKKIGTKREKLKVLRKPLAVLSTYASAVAVLTILALIIVPQMATSFMDLSKSIPQYVASFRDATDQFMSWMNSTFGLNFSTEDSFDKGLFSMVNKFAEFFSVGDLSEALKNFASNIFPWAVDTVKGAYTVAYNWIIGIVASIYFLATKDKLCSQVRKLTEAYAPKKWVNKIFEVTEMSNKVCGDFIIGRVIDSLIMGLLCFIVLTIFRFDYAILISVVVAVTNVIPFFGPFLGAIPSAFLLLMISPTECFWFIVIIIGLQQIDGNIIGPKVIGDKIGISGFWILFSIIVGGGLFGFAGMIMGVPAFVIIYNLLGKDVNKRLLKNKEYISKKPLNEEVATENTEISK
jgi:predicted PurR-regulated permease PerM